MLVLNSFQTFIHMRMLESRPFLNGRNSRKMVVLEYELIDFSMPYFIIGYKI